MNIEQAIDVAEELQDELEAADADNPIDADNRERRAEALSLLIECARFGIE